MLSRLSLNEQRAYRNERREDLENQTGHKLARGPAGIPLEHPIVAQELLSKSWMPGGGVSAGLSLSKKKLLAVSVLSYGIFCFHSRVR